MKTLALQSVQETDASRNALPPVTRLLDAITYEECSGKLLPCRDWSMAPERLRACPFGSINALPIVGQARALIQGETVEAIILSGVRECSCQKQPSGNHSL